MRGASVRKRKLPIGIQTFRTIREDDCYYVDKTGFIRRLVTEGRHYFLSRPRRFGKSLFLDTLKELFEANEALFEGLDIHGRWDWSVRHPVVCLSFGTGGFKEPSDVHREAMAQIDAIERAARVEARYDTAPARFRHLIRTLHQQSGRRVAVLVDEYDKPILDALETPEVARSNRDYLHGLYSTIKDCDADIRFTFLTGVSKFSKVSLFSGLNNLKDITLDRRYSAICGYTDADLTPYSRPSCRDSIGIVSATGTTATAGSGTRRCTTPSTSCCCSTTAGSIPGGSRPARPRSSSRRWRSEGSHRSTSMA